MLKYVNVSFVVSLAEQAAVAAVGAFAATLVAANGSLGKAALVAGLAAAVRAGYGVLVSKLGASGPSVK